MRWRLIVAEDLAALIGREVPLDLAEVYMAVTDLAGLSIQF